MKAYEIDGPARAWFEYKDGEETKRCTYRLFGWRGDNPADLVRKANETVWRIGELSFFTAQAANNPTKHPVIFWRRHFELNYEEPVREGDPAVAALNMQPHNGFWKLTFRLGVVPDLTDAQWREVGERVEGAPLWGMGK
jgi:hypothetical protein